MIEGMKIVATPTFADDRGFIHQIMQATELHLPKIERLYLVGNFGKGVIRGFHKHEKEWKAFFVAAGSVKFVIVKETENPQIETCVLTTRNPCILIVPPGVYTGWMSLEDNTLLLGISNFTIEETKHDDFRIDPYKFGDVWKVKER